MPYKVVPKNTEGTPKPEPPRAYKAKELGLTTRHVGSDFHRDFNHFELRCRPAHMSLRQERVLPRTNNQSMIHLIRSNGRTGL